MIFERVKALFTLKMGCRPSKDARFHENPSKPKDRDRTKTKTGQSSGVEVITVQKYDEIIANVLYKDLKETPEMFVLNNILMNVQFFENYHRDILRISHTEGIKLDNELNKILLKEECMECISPDMIVDKMNKNIRFKPHHGPKKLFSEGMVVKRLYVINDHIDVLNAMENIPQYTSIDKPAYQVRIEESGRKGFVRLKFIDSTKIPKIYEPIEPLQSYTSPASYDTDSDYTSITELRTPKLLDILQGVNVRRDSLPKNYFAPRKVKRRLSASNLDGAYVYVDEEALYEKVTYLDANAFMRDFEKYIFPSTLGEALGFDETEISRAKSIPGKIFCNMLDDEDPDSFIPCEVIPAVSIDWPSEQAFEFEMREDRPTITDRVSGMQYRWPTDEMIQEMKSLSCVLIPSCYYTKYNTKNSTNAANLEWEIAFPKAERYIESRMSHTQLRCLLFLLSIHKTYIEPATHQNGLLVEHIRCHMYWECERDYRDWPEHRLGMKLKQVIINLNKKLSKSEMPDYFIKSKNVFANIPRKYLHFAQKVFHDIIQAPVMHFIKALRNIQTPSDRFSDNAVRKKDFYSSLEWKTLYDILLNNEGLAVLQKSKEMTALRQRRYADRDAQWEHLYHLKQKQERLKKKLAAKKAQEEEQRRKSVDSINTEWICEKEFDVVKSKAILDFFIEHFIKMIGVGTRITSKDQVLFFVKQVMYLTHIVEKLSPSFQLDVEEYRKRLQTLENMIKRQVAVQRGSLETAYPVPPETPIRNSGFDFPSVGNPKKITLQRQKSKNNSFSRPITIVHKATSMKNLSAPKVGFRKSISFVEPEK